MTDWTVNIDGFSGPLDLLLQLIDKQQLDIYDIPIARVTDQYLSYLDQMTHIDLDQASGFLVMAATLLQIKARMLLPDPVTEPDDEDQVDPRSELVAMLIEYRKVQRASAMFAEKARSFNQTYPGCRRTEMKDFLPHEPIQPQFEPEQFMNAVKRMKPLLTAAPPPPVDRDRFPVVRRIRQILKRLRSLEKPVEFRELVDSYDRPVLVSSFLALLELIRLRRAKAVQRRTWGDIIVSHQRRQRRSRSGSDNQD